MALVVSRKHLKAEACVRFEDISSTICGKKSGTIVSSFLSLSVLLSQDYSAHALYSSLSNVVRAIRESGQDL